MSDLLRVDAEQDRQPEAFAPPDLWCPSGLGSWADGSYRHLTDISVRAHPASAFDCIAAVADKIRRQDPQTRSKEADMFSVIFEVHPRPDQWDAYLGNAKMLRPELEQVDGFVDNIRYKSLTREGWILSLSGWRDEKSVVRWRTAMRHHVVQEKGRSEILLDYHLRVGQITHDTHLPAGQRIEEQRLDETEVGEGTTVSFVDTNRPASLPEMTNASDTAEYLGLDRNALGLISWDVYDAVLTPGDLILMMVWKTNADAEAFGKLVKLTEGRRLRRVRVVRDYGMFDRREAPQYYPPVKREPSGA
ncbi:MAG: antibiotic biosynthesis monooxygenase [Xanthobacteraceae bacterium]